MSVTFLCRNSMYIPMAIYDNRDRSYSSDLGDFILRTETPFEFTVANANAPLILEIMGLRHSHYHGPEEGWDLYGELTVDELPKALDAAILAREHHFGPGSTNYIRYIRDLLMYCIHSKENLVWG